jgi:hypothetical protein
VVVGTAAAVADCGIDCVEGSGGAALATSDALSGDESCFQNAQRGPDWQPAKATIASTTKTPLYARKLIVWLPARSARRRKTFAAMCGGRKSTDEDSAGLADAIPRPYEGKACGISIFGKNGRRG